MDTDLELDPSDHVGSYLVEWAKLREYLSIQDMQYAWLISVRVEVPDVLQTRCRHQKWISKMKLDCFHPKDDAIASDQAMMAEYSVVKKRMAADFQQVELPLCDVCTGLQLDPDTRLSEHSIVELLKQQEEWCLWIYFCEQYHVSLPRKPVSELDYATVFAADTGQSYFYQPRPGAKTLEERTADGSSFEFKDSKHSDFKPPYQWHAAYWIFAFLHEILWRHYVSVQRIAPKDRNCKELRHWAKQQARKIKPDGKIWQAMSPLGQHVVDVDLFIQITREFFNQVAPPTQNDIFGFKYLKASDIDLNRIAVELANVVAHLLPKTRQLEPAFPESAQQSLQP